MTTAPEVHIGRNIKRLRAMLHIKQEALALTPGEEMNFATGSGGTAYNT